MSLLRAVPAIVRKELLVEWRQRARVSALFFFSFALLMMVAFAMPNAAILRELSGGALWIGLLLASTRSLDQSMHVELENGALEGLVLWPVPPAAIYYGKALANTLVLFGVALAITPLCVVLYNPPLRGDMLQYVGVLALGCAGLAAPGTLVSVLTAKASKESVYQEAAFFHKPTKSLLLCDAVVSTGIDPPEILLSEPEYRRALLYHARDDPLEKLVESNK